MSTLNIPLLCRRSEKHSLNHRQLFHDVVFMINPQWLELPMSRTNFHGPKDVRAIEVRVYMELLNLCPCDPLDAEIYIYSYMYISGEIWCTRTICYSELSHCVRQRTNFIEQYYKYTRFLSMTRRMLFVVFIIIQEILRTLRILKLGSVSVSRFKQLVTVVSDKCLSFLVNNSFHTSYREQTDILSCRIIT